MSVSERLRQLRGTRTLQDFSEPLGVGMSAISNVEKERSGMSADLAIKIATVYGVTTDWLLTGAGSMKDMSPGSNARLVDGDFVELEFISVKARAGFSELGQMLNEPLATYKVYASNEDSMDRQVVIEVDGDSMEPNFVSGAKVRCREIDQGDWQFLNSGVYAVVYSDFFVIKRVKNGPREGIVTLHSDNTVTGGSFDVPLSQIRRVWKVIRIVDSPVF